MSTETTPTTDLVVVNPATGEAIDLKAATDVELVDYFDRTVELAEKVKAHGLDVQAEAVRRLDRRNTRKDAIEVDGKIVAELETNAPTSDEYPVDATRKALEELVAAEVLHASVIDKVIVTKRPKPPEPVTAVDKRELNKLKGHADPRVAAALGAVRQRTPNRRTLKVTRAEAGR